jgi:uncharacterized protein YegL
VPELQRAAAENPEIDVMLRVLQFDSSARWQNPQPVRVDAFEWHDLEAGGETRMGEALLMIADGLSASKATGRQLPPVIVLVSDGYPSDDIDQALERFFALDLARAAMRIGIAIGGDADLEILERFINQKAIAPLRANNAPMLVQYMKWATTAPVKSVSSPTTDPNPLATMSRDSRTARQTDDDMVW